MTDKKVWLVTGAGRGLGLDIARAALAAGHAVVATGRDPGKVAAAIGPHADLLAVQLDVTRPEDAQAAVAVKFARSLMDNKGEISTLELAEMRGAGYSDADIVEVITHVGMNFLTNILGKASRVEIDFPKVELKLAA